MSIFPTSNLQVIGTNSIVTTAIPATVENIYQYATTYYTASSVGSGWSPDNVTGNTQVPLEFGSDSATSESGFAVGNIPAYNQFQYYAPWLVVINGVLHTMTMNQDGSYKADKVASPDAEPPVEKAVFIYVDMDDEFWEAERQA